MMSDCKNLFIKIYILVKIEDEWYVWDKFWDGYFW